MTNKTQCPNCLTVYFITDEQYQRSKGHVRCGTCRQPFSASFLAENEPVTPPVSPPTSPSSTSPSSTSPSSTSPSSSPSQDASSPPDREQPKEQEKASADSALEAPPAAEQVSAQSFAHRDDNKSKLRTPSEVEDSPSEQQMDVDTHAHPKGKDAKSAPDLANQVDALIGEKIFHQTIPSLPTDDEDMPDASTGSIVFDKELAMRDVDDLHREDSIHQDRIEQVSEDDETEPLLLDEPFYLDGKRPRGKFYRWLVRPLLALIVVAIFTVLSIALVYQLWLRQALPILENEALADQVLPLIEPITAELDEKLGFQLPVRRDLANLRMISARIEPHPSRSSTTLLKVNIVNKSTIAQPFPSMELVLTDEGGRLVSRRSLSAADYLHNNRLQNKIRPNELRQITIELLTFPKQAHGYELKLLGE